MDLHDAAALLTARAQHAFTLQQQANAALTQEGRRTAGHRRLIRLAHQAERAGELAALWDGGLWEAHGTNARDLFPLADPALAAGTRTLRTLTHDQITAPYDLTWAEFTEHAPESPALHWAQRIFLLHAALVDHLPGAATAATELAELHDRLTLPGGRRPHARTRTGRLPRRQPRQCRRQPHRHRRPPGRRLDESTTRAPPTTRRRTTAPAGAARDGAPCCTTRTATLPM